MYRLPIAKRDMPKRFPGYSGPRQIDDSVVFTEPYEGSLKYLELVSNYYVGADASNQVFGPTAPAGGMLWIPWAELYHDDGSNTRQIWIAVEHRTATEIAVASGYAVPTDGRVVLQRPVIVRSGMRLIGNGSNVIIGAKLRLRVAYLGLEAGESIPASL